MEQNTTITGSEFSSDLEHRIIRRDGEVRHILVRASVVKDDSGRIVKRYGANQDITERKQAEEKLKASEDKYRSIFENAVEGIYQAKPEGRYISVNPALARMLGYESPEEMITSVTDIGRQLFVNSEDMERYQAISEKKGEVNSFEAQLYRKDGSATWTSTNARAIRDAAGNVSHFDGTVEDITSRKRADEAIKRTAAEWRTTFDSIEDMIMILDLDCRIVRVNKSVVSFLGLSYSDILGKYCYDLMHWGKRSSEEWCFSKMLNSKKHEESEMYIDEKGIWILTSVDPIFDGKGNITGAVHIMKDVTERKQMEEALRESENKFRDLVEKSIVGVYLIQDKLFKYVNTRFAEIHGYTVEELVDKKSVQRHDLAGRYTEDA